MSEKKGFIARLLGKQDESDCCAVRIEEVPETEVARMPAAKKSACCAPRIEKVPELEVAQTPTAKKSACCAVRIEEVKEGSPQNSEKIVR